MKLQYTVLAIALAGIVALPAFAEGDAADIHSNTYVGNHIDVSGRVKVRGKIKVASESAATVDQDQTTLLNQSLGDGDHDAHLGGDALSDAQGNIGANVAAGVGNAQANDTALSAVDGEKVFASAMVFGSQASLGNFATTNTDDTYYDATLDGNALSNAKGNIGVNVAAGVGNAQGNGMAASVNSSGTVAIATSDSEQLSVGNLLDSEGRRMSLDLYASLDGNALSGAQGNIGVNVASGIGNLQHNGLSIATASCGACAPPPPPPPCTSCGD
ncbi:hypothetical protein [Lysobacter gummosus]|uniref:Uncharacterized protein n=1 Tax=Lysobacter gummosus TaxID=262324 RepID=A0ABY3XEV2_9GAMM|nr:hypothetical protein [Lysobacter gummosus]ALN89022.1 hypothetical protein LG3211_0032 [Lysobacter gummosus]UNP29738.1 hypothetical protein MOV92_00165 [Lysobacter gummosus]